MSLDLLNRQDNLSGIRNGLRRMAKERGDYSGCPMPLEGLNLTIEPTFKYKGLDTIFDKLGEEPGGAKIRNIFWSTKYRCSVAICQDPDGKIWHAPLIGSANSATAILHTIGASDAWGIEQESNALQLLGHHVSHRKMKQYLLTGSFIETSPRSGVTYVFRKLRPTIALRVTETGSRILCTLCMHPIGYYEQSWAGCMTPTDDVIAHLLLCRGDEKMFWRRCNQHCATAPESGL